MTLSPSTEDDFEVIDSVQADERSIVEIIQYKQLEGSSDVRTAENLFFATQSGMKLKMVRIRLNDSHVRVEPGGLYYMKGNLEIKASTGGGLLKGLARKFTSGESLFVNEIHGSGEIYLEPTFGHFFLHRIDANEGGVIVDKGLFYAGTAGLDISATHQKSLSSAVLGKEGLFQTRIAGTGIAVLYSPVPSREIQRQDLVNDKLWVDGNFVLMRSEAVNYRVEKSSKSWLATSVSGERMLQTFDGAGFVWIAPTQGIYERLASKQGLQELAGPPGSYDTNTQSLPS